MAKSKKTPLLQASAINHVFAFFIIAAILFAAYSGKMQQVSEASIETAQSAVNLSLKMLGVMALWLGLMRILEAGGLMQKIAYRLKPLMCKLFPDVPTEHPAMSAMILNISANILGLGNAATPFGVKAMAELNKLNPFKDKATNAMCLFLAINTSSVTLLPLGAISILAAAGNKTPSSIIIPTLIATFVSTIVGVSCALFFARRDVVYKKELQENQNNLKVDSNELCAKSPVDTSYDHLLVTPNYSHKIISLLCLFSFVALFVFRLISSDNSLSFLKNEFLSAWLIPMLIFGMLVYGVFSGVKIYEAVCEGAKQGFDIAVKIIPFLVAILVAIGMFRASGAMDLLIAVFNPLTSIIGMPAEVLPMALMRPLSGSGAMGVMSSIIEHSPNSYSAYLSAILNGSTETTFYVLAVYFGSVGITKIRHALVAGLCADLAGVLAACTAAKMFW